MLENLFGSGKIEKMIVQVATVDAEGNVIPTVDDTLIFAVQVNPESYSLNYNIKYNYTTGHGDTGSEPRHACNSPRVLEFEFLFDGTGVIPKSAGPLDGVPLAGAIAGAISDLLSGGEDDVDTQLEKFITVVDYDGVDHKPHILLLAWGKLAFPCVLTRLSITYKLFDPGGIPLRATAKATFTEFTSNRKRVTENRDSSPDLTHLRQAIAGDKLPLMVNKIYRTPDYYLQVARANNLYNFRSVKAGTKLSFPPIDKKTK